MTLPDFAMPPRQDVEALPSGLTEAQAAVRAAIEQASRALGSVGEEVDRLMQLVLRQAPAMPALPEAPPEALPEAPPAQALDPSALAMRISQEQVSKAVAAANSALRLGNEKPQG